MNARQKLYHCATPLARRLLTVMILIFPQVKLKVKLILKIQPDLYRNGQIDSKIYGNAKDTELPNNLAEQGWRFYTT